MVAERKKNRLPNKRESQNARNRSASAKWARNRGESSAHSRVKWTVDNINRTAAATGETRNGGKFRTFCKHPALLLPSLSQCQRRFPLYLSFLLSSSSHDSALRENTSTGFFRVAVSSVPRRKSLNVIKVFLEKILREVSSEFKGKPFI